MEDISNNNRLWTKDYEERVIHILQSSGECAIVKNGKFYYYKKNFKLVSMAGVTKVATIKDSRIMAIKENVFSIISDFHSACGHKGEKKTYKAVSEHYANISMPFIKQFIAQCERCTEKSKRNSQKGIVVRPITSNDLNQRGQVDLVDFQSLPDGEFKYILHYKEHLTKYSFLRPLVTKKAIEVARELFNIFLDFGAPHILQSDNGREFTADIIKELGSLWPDLIFINGRPRHPQSQGSVERSNCTLKNSLIAWMRDNRTSSWSLGLRIVQWGMNSTYHEGIKMSPYVAMFGQKAKMSLTSKLPKDF